MPSEKNQVEIIEQYLRGELALTERKALETQMREDAALAAEVEAYRQILEGFGAIQMSDFDQSIKEWETEWAPVDKEEIQLIEWYVSGKLGGKALEQLETRLQQDAKFAEKVNQYKAIIEGFAALQMKEFSDTMKGWDTQDDTVQPEAKRIPLRRAFLRVAAAAAVLLLLVAGANWYANSNYSDEFIITDLYEGRRSQNVMGDDQNAQRAIDQQYQSAHERFQAKQYQEALDAFDLLLNQLPSANLDRFTATYYRENAEWNRILAQIGADKPHSEVMQSLETLLNTENHSYKDNARKLQSRLNSFWKKWAD